MRLQLIYNGSTHICLCTGPHTSSPWTWDQASVVYPYLLDLKLSSETRCTQSVFQPGLTHIGIVKYSIHRCTMCIQWLCNGSATMCPYIPDCGERARLKIVMFGVPNNKCSATPARACLWGNGYTMGLQWVYNRSTIGLQ
jgi:hypothetical protein